jgi:ribosomal subunit interface protein
MKTNVTFRHTKGTHPELQETAIKLADGFQKYHDNITSTNVEFINDNDKEVHIVVNLTGTTLTAHESSDDFHKSLHEASDKIITQIKKLKTKQLSSRG